MIDSKCPPPSDSLNGLCRLFTTHYFPFHSLLRGIHVIDFACSPRSEQTRWAPEYREIRYALSA